MNQVIFNTSGMCFVYLNVSQLVLLNVLLMCTDWFCFVTRVVICDVLSAITRQSICYIYYSSVIFTTTLQKRISDANFYNFVHHVVDLYYYTEDTNII